jgi:hypothetical protein
MWGHKPHFKLTQCPKGRLKDKVILLNVHSTWTCVDFCCRNFRRHRQSVEDEMSAQETTSLETAIERQLTAPRAEPKGPAGPNFSPQSAAPKPAKPVVTAESAPPPQNENPAPGNSRSQTASADRAPASETAGKDTAEAPATPDF